LGFVKPTQRATINKIKAIARHPIIDPRRINLITVKPVMGNTANIPMVKPMAAMAIATAPIFQASLHLQVWFLH
jgi:hypothetical protein